MPNGTPTRIARPKPVRTRRSVAAVLATSARSVNSAGMLRSTSPGLGSTTGETIRVSGEAPNVTAHQTSTAIATPAKPTVRFTSGGGGSRSVNSRRMSDGLAGAAVAAAAGPSVVTDSVTAGRLLRLERIDLDLHATILRVVVRIARICGPIPSPPGRRELIGLQRRELAHERLLHGIRAAQRQLLHVGRRHAARVAHRGVRVTLDDDARSAELPGELARFFHHEAGVRIISLLHRFPVH